MWWNIRQCAVPLMIFVFVCCLLFFIALVQRKHFCPCTYSHRHESNRLSFCGKIVTIKSQKTGLCDAQRHNENQLNMYEAFVILFPSRRVLAASTPPISQMNISFANETTSRGRCDVTSGVYKWKISEKRKQKWEKLRTRAHALLRLCGWINKMN